LDMFGWVRGIDYISWHTLSLSGLPQHSIKEGKVHPYTGAEALYRP
jgi:hypothetical protein